MEIALQKLGQMSCSEVSFQNFVWRTQNMPHVWHKIIEKLTAVDVVACLRTCRDFRAIVIKMILSSVKLHKQLDNEVAFETRKSPTRSENVLLQGENVGQAMFSCLDGNLYWTNTVECRWGETATKNAHVIYRGSKKQEKLALTVNPGGAGCSMIKPTPTANPDKVLLLLSYELVVPLTLNDNNAAILGQNRVIEGHEWSYLLSHLLWKPSFNVIGELVRNTLEDYWIVRFLDEDALPERQLPLPDVRVKPSKLRLSSDNQVLHTETNLK